MLRIDEIEMTDYRKQLGKCPKCGNTKAALRYLIDIGMCEDCWIEHEKAEYDQWCLDGCPDPMKEDL